MTKENEYYAYFTVVGDFDPTEITAQIELQPSECWMKGSRNEKTHKERTFSRWNLYSRLSRAASLEDQLKDVVEQLEPVQAAVVQTAANFKAYINLVGYFYIDFPGLVFDPSLIARLAALKLGFDCDFYYMYSDKREDS